MLAYYAVSPFGVRCKPALSRVGRPLRAANKTILALLPDFAVLHVLSAVVRLARIAALAFVSRS